MLRHPTQTLLPASSIDIRGTRMKKVDDASGIASWPDPIGVDPYVECVSTSELNAEQKERLWRHLLATHPEEAKCIKALSQSRVIDIVFRVFDAGFSIRKELVPPGLWSELRPNTSSSDLNM